MTPAGPRIVVVGSCNLDQTFTVIAAPGPGETVGSQHYSEEAGGKGLNQALAAARFGADVRFVGAVGDDDAGRLVRRVMHDSDVDDSLLRTVTQPTGRASIVVDADRENRIVLLGGANQTVRALTHDEESAVVDADALLLQLELPQSVVAEAAQAAARSGVLVGLTPAPVQLLPSDLLDSTGILFANEHEAAAMTSEAALEAGLRSLLDMVPAVVVTRGAHGSDYADRAGQRLHRPAEPAAAVDTTAAGDVYAGVFLTSHAAGLGVAESMSRATHAAAIAVQRAGTSRSIPWAAEVAGLAVG